ncbi:hypothetical protein KP509_17G051600 [Ceratopteris richardii]|uniref:Uncharacterized protein n=1 Tax=Ceratopteris richardii TaxID=49495 RepID=A0A8T2SVR5_CERRI|nr:hypothetical protein KP509_17G051600 [Ceratopteris richardii]
MEYFARVLSGKSMFKERNREAEQLKRTFEANLDALKSIVQSEKTDDIIVLLSSIYESSFPEEQVFMKMPNPERLRSKKELVLRLLCGLDSIGAPVAAELILFLRKHGTEAIADTLVALMELLCPLLEGKETPDFTTDDVLNAMDFEWHTNSRTASPLLNAIASATSSPRASAASVGDSPFQSLVTASPFRRAISDRSIFQSRSKSEQSSKPMLTKASSIAVPDQSTLPLSYSPQLACSGEVSRSEQAIAAIPEITLPPVEESPRIYKLDARTSQHGSQGKHRRKSSSLRQLFAEDEMEEIIQAAEGSYSASSSRRQYSLDIAKLPSVNIFELPSSNGESSRKSADMGYVGKLSDKQIGVDKSRRMSSHYATMLSSLKEDSGDPSSSITIFSDSDCNKVPSFKISEQIAVNSDVTGNDGQIEKTAPFSSTTENSVPAMSLPQNFILVDNLPPSLTNTTEDVSPFICNNEAIGRSIDAEDLYVSSHDDGDSTLEHPGAEEMSVINETNALQEGKSFIRDESRHKICDDLVSLQNPLNEYYDRHGTGNNLRQILQTDERSNMLKYGIHHRSHSDSLSVKKSPGTSYPEEMHVSARLRRRDLNLERRRCLSEEDLGTSISCSSMDQWKASTNGRERVPQEAIPDGRRDMIIVTDREVEQGNISPKTKPEGILLPSSENFEGEGDKHIKHCDNEESLSLSSSETASPEEIGTNQSSCPTSFCPFGSLSATVSSPDAECTFDRTSEKQCHLVVNTGTLPIDEAEPKIDDESYQDNNNVVESVATLLEGESDLKLEEVSVDGRHTLFTLQGRGNELSDVQVCGLRTKDTSSQHGSMRFLECGIHQRCLSDLTPIRTSFIKDSMKGMEWNGSQTDFISNTESIRHTFKEQLRLVTASMHSLTRRKTTPNRVLEVVMDGSMPWMKRDGKVYDGHPDKKINREKVSPSESESDSYGAPSTSEKEHRLAVKLSSSEISDLESKITSLSSTRSEGSCEDDGGELYEQNLESGKEEDAGGKILAHSRLHINHQVKVVEQENSLLTSDTQNIHNQYEDSKRIYVYYNVQDSTQVDRWNAHEESGIQTTSAPSEKQTYYAEADESISRISLEHNPCEEICEVLFCDPGNAVVVNQKEHQLHDNGALIGEEDTITHNGTNQMQDAHWNPGSNRLNESRNSGYQMENESNKNVGFSYQKENEQKLILGQNELAPIQGSLVRIEETLKLDQDTALSSHIGDQQQQDVSAFCYGTDQKKHNISDENRDLDYSISSYTLENEPAKSNDESKEIYRQNAKDFLDIGTDNSGLAYSEEANDETNSRLKHGKCLKELVALPIVHALSPTNDSDDEFNVASSDHEKMGYVSLREIHDNTPSGLFNGSDIQEDAICSCLQKEAIPGGESFSSGTNSSANNIDDAVQMSISDNEAQAIFDVKEKIQLNESDSNCQIQEIPKTRTQRHTFCDSEKGCNLQLAQLFKVSNSKESANCLRYTDSQFDELLSGLDASEKCVLVLTENTYMATDSMKQIMLRINYETIPAHLLKTMKQFMLRII